MALGGVLYALGHVGFGLWPLLLFCLVPLWRTLERCSLLEALLQGLVFGTAAYAVGYQWLWSLRAGFMGGQDILSVGLWFLYGAWFAFGFMTHAALVQGLLRRGVSTALSTVCSLVLVQWLQPQLFGAELGAGLIHAPWLPQFAELGGPLLLTAWVGVVNLSVLSLTKVPRPGPLGPPTVAVLASAAVVVFGAVRTSGPPDAPATLSVGIVQTNLRPGAGPVERLRDHSKHLAMSRSLVADGSLDLLVWPESAYGPGLNLPLPLAGHGIRKELTVPLLFGGTSIEYGSGTPRLGNAAFLIEGDGMIRRLYRKRKLIPLAEYNPLSSTVPELDDWFPHAQRFSPGSDEDPLQLDSWRITTPICYEMTDADFVRGLVLQQRPHLIVSLANDAWFGASQEPWIHMSLARLRAIEHRRWVIRATNTGISAIIDPLGRVVAQTPLQMPATLVASVSLAGSVTLFTRLGAWPGWCALIMVAFGLGRGALVSLSHVSQQSVRPRSG